jgi:hypothetical protein
MSDNQIALFILGLFCLAPLLSAFLDSKLEDLKAFINKKLKPHGLRLKERA